MERDGKGKSDAFAEWNSPVRAYRAVGTHTERRTRVVRCGGKDPRDGLPRVPRYRRTVPEATGAGAGLRRLDGDGRPGAGTTARSVRFSVSGRGFLRDVGADDRAPWRSAPVTGPGRPEGGLPGTGFDPPQGRCTSRRRRARRRRVRTRLRADRADQPSHFFQAML
ncbi:hypothetical protein GCM10010405_18560 [Streptomyces macrosporus]|uniref:Uncharacterized protein n=1 Tax=Streptomyces macrosporus TaxID=44032 RepID=A0ABP5WWT1_9ACTN